MNYSLDYNNMSDEELINSIRADDKKALEFLICKYKDLVNSKVNKYFLRFRRKMQTIPFILTGFFNTASGQFH